MALFPTGISGNPDGRPKGSIGKITREVREIARTLVEDPDYVESLRARLAAGTAAHMEPVLFYYTYGKPIERVAPVNPDGTGYEANRETEELVSLIADLRIWLGREEEEDSGGGLPH